jgi:hypothetical protein
MRAPRASRVIAAVGNTGGGYRVPRFRRDDIRGLAEFILGFCRLT